MNIRLLARTAAAVSLMPASAFAQEIAARYRTAAETIIAAALRDSSAYDRLAELSDRFGHRLSGSRSLENALDWILSEMRKDGLENVRGEPVMVPHWVRGRESAMLVQPRALALHMVGLGGSIATPRAGITAPVLVVTSFDDLTRRSAEARGKIILFNVPFTGYGQTVRYRGRAAIEAAKVGAVAALIRSVESNSMQNPHTGAMGYDSAVKRIPAAALSGEDAAMLHRMQKRGQRVVVKLMMEARTLPDAPSRNVVAELRGREKPDELVVLGGHIDSWDVGQGAMDDGGGSVAAWEAVRLLQRLGLRPRRTLRVVLWTNEENGLRGAQAYYRAHESEIAKHVMAMESDGGVFSPEGFSVEGSEAAVEMMRGLAPLLAGIGATQISAGGSGADISPLTAAGVPGLGLNVDGTRYFWYHHSAADTIDKLDPAEMARCVAAMAVMAYVVAEMPETLPRRAPR